MPFDKKIPKVNIKVLNGLEGTVNHIQLEVEGVPYLRINNKSHGEILRDFLDECEETGEYLGLDKQEVERLKSLREPPISAGAYKVIGMGTVDVYSNIMNAMFGGFSTSYQLSFNNEHLKKMPIYAGWLFKQRE